MNVWIQPLTRTRKHCYHCEQPITLQNGHISVGEYLRGTFHTGFHGCGMCLIDEVAHRLHTHTFTLKARSGYRMPWYKEYREGYEQP